jgi:hypothetical protein
MQNKNRLGCLTSTGILATLITVFAIVGVAFASGSDMFSAGALNAQGNKSYGGVTSHAQITECGACHVAPWATDTMADHCMNCHTDIAVQMRDVAQLHGILYKNAPTLACRQCHTEHNGAGAPQTVMNVNGFPHDMFRFSLAKHKRNTQFQPITCEDCHTNGVATFTPDSCQNCHQKMNIVFSQAHLLEYGSNCIACHDGVDRYGEDFSHNNFTFQLYGKHIDIACSQCHLNARSVADLQSTPQDCFACHKKDDAHKGQFGNNCAACHTSAGWKPANFDHNLSNFKLEGQHANVKCEQCHINNVFKGTASNCYSCHQKDDKHNGQFGMDCSACHTPNGWGNATFDHNLSTFKLLGKHANVECKQCHVNNVFKGTPSDCYACHQKDDKHNGQFGKDCSGCHTPNSWGDATFDHNKSNFPLTGGHINLDCTKCHTNGQFKGTPTTCASCHADSPFHAGAFGTDCASCHNTSNWNQAIFNLPHPQPTNGGEGGSGITHGGAACRQCHPSSVREATCTACHDSNNPNGGG